ELDPAAALGGVETDRDGRELDGERRPLVLSRATDRDRSAVQLGQVARDGQPDAETPLRARRGAVGLAEPLEDVLEELGTDPAPGVGDANLEAGRGPV